jgi:hypothetical protein
MIRSTPNAPTFLYDNLPLHWQMTRSEKFVFASILNFAAPKTAIEIGTYQGGSLQLLSTHCGKVYSVDLSDEYHKSLKNRFPNVEFFLGDSKNILPKLLHRIEENSEELGFILIDGDHSTEGVRSDIEIILRHVPRCPLYVVLHDSFYPPCRKGMLSAGWEQSEYVHYVEIDFVPGVYHYKAFDTAPPRFMCAGLALALLLPEKRKDQLTVYQSQKALYDAVFPHSYHAPLKLFHKIASRLSHKLFDRRPTAPC